MSRDMSVDTALRNLGMANKKIVKAERAVVAEHGKRVRKQARQDTPVDTGANRRSISTTTTVKGGVITNETGPTTDYGIWLEVGTRRMLARPYLGPAFDATYYGWTEKEIDRVMVEILSEAVT